MESLKLSDCASPSPVSLRLRDTDQPSTTGGLSAEMTLSEIYHHAREGFRRGLVANRSAKRNIAQYDQTVGYWARYARNFAPGCEQFEPDEPPLCRITDETCDNWLITLGELPGRGGEPISVNTIRKHCTHLQAVLDFCAPKSRDKKFQRSKGLIADVPVLQRPAPFVKEPDDSFSVDEMSMILANCHLAAAPSYLPPSQRHWWWRYLFLGAYNLGLRVGSLVEAEWARLKQDKRGWWLTVVVKGRKEKKVYVNKYALEVIELMRPMTGQFKHIWHWPHQLNWLHIQRRQIVAAAGLPPDRQLGFHAFRKAMVTEVSEHDPLAGQMQAGHTNFQTTQNHYLHPARVASGMDKLPQPAKPQQGRQLDLF